MNRLPLDRLQVIQERLESAFPGSHIELTDQSHLHAGHVGAQSGKGHYALEIVAREFSGRNKVERHRMVYDSLAELMQTEIHALTIDAKSP